MIIFTDRINRNEFDREATIYSRIYSEENVLLLDPRLNRTKGKLKNEVLNYILHHKEDYDSIAFFMHGSSRKLKGAALNLWNCHQLADTVVDSYNANLTKDIKIILYSCKCGRQVFPAKRRDKVKLGKVSGWDGFAMRLAEAFALLGVNPTIIAHTTRGHTTRNPSCVRIISEDEYILRRDIVPYVSSWAGRKNPKGRKQWLKWVDLMHNDLTYRFRFPFLTQQEIENDIS